MISTKNWWYGRGKKSNIIGSKRERGDSRRNEKTGVYNDGSEHSLVREHN